MSVALTMGIKPATCGEDEATEVSGSLANLLIDLGNTIKGNKLSIQEDGQPNGLNYR